MNLIHGKTTAARPPAFESAPVVAVSILLIALYARVLVIRWGQAQTLPDFSIFWIVGRLAAAGKGTLAYDWVTMNGLVDEAFGKPHWDYLKTFVYPPMLMLLLAPLGLLPFAKAAAVWFALNLTAYLAGMRAILPGATAMLAALAAPVVLFNLSTGQNGLLTAGLLGGALAFVDARPLVSGVLIGLLAYKPQFGVLLPFFLAATGRWQVFASAAVTLAAFAGIAAIAFGWEVFAAFVRSVPLGVDGYLQHVRVPRAVIWGALESVYGLLRAIGAGNAAAWTGHFAIALACVIAALGIARSRVPYALQAAALATAAVVVTPYSELNDTAILMVPWAFLLRDGVARGFRRWEKAVMAAVFLLPLSWFLLRGMVRSLWLPELESWAGIAPAMAAMLVVLIGCRLRHEAADRLPAVDAARAGS